MVGKLHVEYYLDILDILWDKKMLFVMLWYNTSSKQDLPLKSNLKKKRKWPTVLWFWKIKLVAGLWLQNVQYMLWSTFLAFWDLWSDEIPSSATFVSFWEDFKCLNWGAKESSQSKCRMFLNLEKQKIQSGLLHSLRKLQNYKPLVFFNKRVRFAWRNIVDFPQFRIDALDIIPKS